MAVTKIHGAEHSVSRIFSKDFNFRIPLYQRPYSWTTEQASELLDDIVEFIGSDTSIRVDDLSPYFLGSIVLIKEDGNPDAEVVDGQQRLTTLTILLAALRSSISQRQFAQPLTKYLYEEGDPIEGHPNRYRITLRERDADFFRSYVQDEGSIVKLKSLEPAQLSDSCRNIRANAILYLDCLTEMPEDQRVRLAQFIIRNCLLVVVSTPDFDSAYRIFSILNDRGMDLSHADILKSDIIGRIPQTEQDTYSNRWEDAEDELGRDSFSDLIAYVRTIHRKQKLRESVLKEFREYVIKEISDPKKLIDDVLLPYADAFAIIQTASYQSTHGAEAVNEMLRWLNRIDNTDWIPPAIAFLARKKSEPDKILRFFCDLERLAAFQMICRCGINERADRYARVLNAIETDMDLASDESPLQLSDDEMRRFISDLDGPIYLQVPKRRLYVLLRLDSALSDGSATYDHTVISIEHVLPQNPPQTSQWCEWFPNPSTRERWVHRLGNLLLLNQRKNSSASNYDFERKKAAYFSRRGVSPFPLTTHAINYSVWTEDVLQERQRMMLEKLKQTWRLTANILDDEPEVDDDDDDDDEPGQRRSGFHSEIIPLLEQKLGTSLKKQSRVHWVAPDNSVLVSCQVSKKFNNMNIDYWFGFKRSTKEALAAHPNSYCAFGLGSPKHVVLIPYSQLAPYLEQMYTSPEKDGGVMHWHVQIREQSGKVEILLAGQAGTLDVTKYVLKMK